MTVSSDRPAGAALPPPAAAPSPDPGGDLVRSRAAELRDYAGHFSPRDWDYTRDTRELDHIRYRHDYTGHNRLDRRILGGIRAAARLHGFLAPRGLRARLITLRVWAAKADNLPDGVLDSGNIITHWEETGEYLQYVQPSVGLLLADWMDAEPDSLHAALIAAEMTRIGARYTERLKGVPGE